MSGQLFIGKADATPGDPSEWTEVGFADGVTFEHDDRPILDAGARRFSTSGTSTLTFEGSLDRDALLLLAGERIGMAVQPPPPVQSVVFEYVDWASGAPYVAPLRTGWRYWFDKVTGRRRHYELLRAIKRAHWIAAGCPKRPVQHRIVIPRATITPGDQTDGTTVLTVTPQYARQPWLYIGSTA